MADPPRDAQGSVLAHSNVAATMGSRDVVKREARLPWMSPGTATMRLHALLLRRHDDEIA
jgi:hypothetical protein